MFEVLSRPAGPISSMAWGQQATENGLGFRVGRRHGLGAGCEKSLVLRMGRRHGLGAGCEKSLVLRVGRRHGLGAGGEKGLGFSGNAFVHVHTHVRACTSLHMHAHAYRHTHMLRAHKCIPLTECANFDSK